jgi:nuclear pore complex protein Nup155
MLEIILLIFHVSDHRDTFLIASTWEAILERGRAHSSFGLARYSSIDVAFVTAHQELVEKRMDVVVSQIVNLGRRFAHSDVAFPLCESIRIIIHVTYLFSIL